MKAYRFKKHRMQNVKINVIVVPEDVVFPGRKINLSEHLPKPRLPKKLFTNITRPAHDGRVEFTFDGKI